MGVLILNVECKMSKTLKVITPFFTLGIGDVLELSSDGNFYEFKQEERFGQNSADGTSDYESLFTTSLNISVEHAKELIAEGYLSEETTQDKFVNVFDEIDNLLQEYKKDLDEVNKDADEVPACLKVEKTTVLNNLIKVLTHLKNLKK